MANKLFHYAFRGLMVSLIFTFTMLKAQTETQRLYLSGHGCDDMVEWEFYCTKGMQSGEWTKIGVPSCWENQGFGQWQYGQIYYGQAFPEGVADEQGLYRYGFVVPKEWKDRTVELVFDGVMSDAEVKVNGKPAGDIHHGAFYRFKYDVTELLHFGKENILEVTVSKESTNAGVNLAERRADYWNFGGIFRPVYLLSHPKQHIRHAAINAGADGTFQADIDLSEDLSQGRLRVDILNAKGQIVKQTAEDFTDASSSIKVATTVKRPALWSAETPVRYQARFILLDAAGKELHRRTDWFGFRTVEVREHDGVYINGQKVLMKGVCRHSFRPESGRCLSYQKQVEDVLLMRGMNMNAVRSSHYPPDEDFLSVCDSLGLYVLDELSGWHGHHDTENGRILVREMVELAVNHPSVFCWSNGNETGWNNDLNDEFAKYDPQHRGVVHPITTFREFNCAHYNSYGDLAENLRKPEIYMPTEFLHGLYDGGHGAGLYDYWELMRKAPRCAGGFLWVFADEGVVRTDDNNRVDCNGQYAPDGIVGPHLEKEGSYFAIREIWAPVQLFAPNELKWRQDDISRLKKISFRVENRYDFLNLSQCKFHWEWQQLPNALDEGIVPTILKQGEVQGPDVAPQGEGILTIPAVSLAADVLQVTALDDRGEAVFTWSYPIESSAPKAEKRPESTQKMDVVQTWQYMRVDAGEYRYFFDRQESGCLVRVEHGKDRLYDLGEGGPRLMALHRGDRMNEVFTYHQDRVKSMRTSYVPYEDLGKVKSFDVEESSSDSLVMTVRYELGSMDWVRWSFKSDGTVAMTWQYTFNGVVDALGITMGMKEEQVKSKRWQGFGPYRVWQNRLQGLQYGVYENDYNDSEPAVSFDYPEFKGFFRDVRWMILHTEAGTITIEPAERNTYLGVFEPRDGADHQLYKYPEMGISLLEIIPPVRNKNHETDRIGPSSQPHWVNGSRQGRATLYFE